MIENYYGGIVPDPIDAGSAKTAGTAFNMESGHPVQALARSFQGYDFSRAIEITWSLIASLDQFLTRERPWVLAQNESDRPLLAVVLYFAADALRFVTAAAHPVIPDATQKIWQQLGQTDPLADVGIGKLQLGGLKPGTRIGKPEAVFPRVDKKEAYERIEAMENEIRNPGATPPVAATTAAAAPASGAPAPAGAKITIDDFAKVELRVGVIKSAERIQGADKLLKIMVDIGDEVRQVLAGIALAYAPENLVGRKVVIVVNLAPRKMRGLESNGMLLAASTADGNPVLCTFAEDIPAGSKVK
jgi:methionyl-tRNA synthetase